jgi:hypothetical protein
VGVARGSNCFVQSGQSSGLRSWIAGTATAGRHMRPVLAVVGHATAVEGAPIAVAAAGDCMTGPGIAVGGYEAETAALDLAPVHDVAGSSGSSVGVVGGQQLAFPPTWS